MGQKLEKISEKDEDTLDHLVWPEQTGSMPETEAGVRDQEDDSLATPPSVDGITRISVSGHVQRLTATSACTDPQTGQQGRAACLSEHPPSTRGRTEGGDRQSPGSSLIVEELKRALSFKDTGKNSEVSRKKRQRSETKAAAMEEGRNAKKAVDNNQVVGLTRSCDPENEDFVVLEKDGTWVTSAEENKALFGNRTKEHDPQTGDDFRDDNFHETEKSRSKLTDHVQANIKTSPNACSEEDMGQRLAEVTGSRCQLKGAGHVRAEATERGEERRESMNEQSWREVPTGEKKQLPSTMSKNRQVKTVEKSNDEYEGALHKTKQLILPEETERSKHQLELEELSPSKTQGREDYKLGFTAQTTTKQLNRFAGAVSKRAQVNHISSGAREEQIQTFSDSTEPSSSNTPEVQKDNSPVFYPPLLENECCDRQIQTANLKKESTPVCFSAVITPPPLTHVLPKKDLSGGSQQEPSVVDADTDVASTTEKPVPKGKVKGPPPPVPKKPKNPFIKLKTAQLMSNEVQRRNKDSLRSEEKVKRRHTFHFGKDPPRNPVLNQDMCLLWDEGGASIIPPNIRQLSVDLSPWEDFSLRQTDERFGDMIDFDYCTRMASLSGDKEPKHLDMLQRVDFLERRLRGKDLAPHAKKSQWKLASTEMLHVPEVTSGNEVESTKPAEVYTEVTPQVSYENNLKPTTCKEATDHNTDLRADSDVVCYKPVAEIIKETNQTHRCQNWAKPEAAKVPVRVPEPSSSMKVSQMKNTFDVPKKSKERPQEVQAPLKKGMFCRICRQHKQLAKRGAGIRPIIETGCKLYLSME